MAEFVRDHERFSDARWALSADALAPFKSIAERLRPDDLVERHAWLFKDRWLHLPEEEGRSHEEIENEARKAALQEILDREGIGGAIVLASNTDHPDLVLNPLLEIIDNVDVIWDLLDRRHEFPDPIAYLVH